MKKFLVVFLITCMIFTLVACTIPVTIVEPTASPVVEEQITPTPDIFQPITPAPIITLPPVSTPTPTPMVIVQPTPIIEEPIITPTPIIIVIQPSTPTPAPSSNPIIIEQPTSTPIVEKTPEPTSTQEPIIEETPEPTSTPEPIIEEIVESTPEPTSSPEPIIEEIVESTPEPTSSPELIMEEELEESINSAFLGQWYAQGTSILWEVTIYEDGTFFNHYPNYSVGDMTYTWELKDNGNIIVLFETNYSFDEYGSLIDKEWNAQGRSYQQRILTRIPNIMGWWRSDDSFIEGEIYPDEEHGIAFYLDEYYYGKTFSISPTGILTFFDKEPSSYQYDINTDTLSTFKEDGTQVILHRWIDDSLQ